MIISPKDIKNVCTKAIANEEHPLYRSYDTFYFKDVDKLPYLEIINKYLEDIKRVAENQNERSPEVIIAGMLAVDRLAFSMKRYFVDTEIEMIVASGLIQEWLDNTKSIIEQNNFNNKLPINDYELFSTYVNIAERVCAVIRKATRYKEFNTHYADRPKPTEEKNEEKEGILACERTVKSIYDAKLYIEEVLFKHVNNLIEEKGICNSKDKKINQVMGYNQGWSFIDNRWSTGIVYSEHADTDSRSMVLTVSFMPLAKRMHNIENDNISVIIEITPSRMKDGVAEIGCGYTFFEVEKFMDLINEKFGKC